MGGFFIAIIALLVAAYLSVGNSAIAAVTSSQANSNDTGVTVHNSDSSLTGSEITENQATYPGASTDYPSANVWNICTAVALAEGFNRGSGAAPYDLNNPGDLSPGDEGGQATAMAPQFHDGSSIIVFATCEGGFVALYKKFNNIVNGQSHVYPKSWTWAQVAAKYAGDSSAWLSNVTSYLGVSPFTTPADYQA